MITFCLIQGFTTYEESGFKSKSRLQRNQDTFKGFQFEKKKKLLRS